MAMSLVHGGSGFPYFAVPVYNYLCGMDIQCIKVNTYDIPEMEVKTLLYQVQYHTASQHVHNVEIVFYVYTCR